MSDRPDHYSLRDFYVYIFKSMGVIHKLSYSRLYCSMHDKVVLGWPPPALLEANTLEES